MKTFTAKPHEVKCGWYLVDANGKVTAIAIGSATITASTGGKSASALFTVGAAVLGQIGERGRLSPLCQCMRAQASKN